MGSNLFRTKSNKRRLRCENLEARCLLAGDLTLQLLTNQLDIESASQALGIQPGTYVQWSYKVTNNGLDTFDRFEILVTDDNATPGQPADDFSTNSGVIFLDSSTDVGLDNRLSPGESWTYTSWRPAQELNQGVYANTATVTSGTNSASDTGFYASPQPAIDIEKFTNGQDADTVAAAVPLFPGAPITWTYRVTNTGNVTHPVENVFVIDDNGTPGLSADDFDSNNGITLIPSLETADGILFPGETWVYSATASAADLGKVPPAPVTIEAESLNQTGFSSQPSTSASGGRIQRLSLFGGSGELWTAFAGATNTYDIKVFAQDESDGVSTIDVSVAGTNVGTIVLDQGVDGGGDDNGTFSEFVLPGIAINELDEVRLAVQGNAGELVRIDKLEFVGGEINTTYGNRGEVWVSSEVSDFDLSHYTNPEIQPAKLGNFVFSDINMNGIQDFGEAGVPGITVTLTGGGADGVIGTADDTTEVQQTTELGVYLFRDLIPGDEYQVSFSNLPEGYEFSPADQGIDDELDSDVDAAGQTQIIVLGSDEDNRSIDAGIFETVIPGAIGDFVFSDVSRDGIRDAAEVGVPDVTVTLAGGGTDGVLGTADDTTATQQTVADGSYKFEGLTPGVEYQVTFSNLPAGFEFTQANEGTDDSLDSDAVPLTGVTPIVVLANGEENLSIDAGIIESIVPSSIGDFVFLDMNRDGIQDEGETGFANITVTLTGAGPDGLLDTLDDTTATRITDPDGFYEFGDLDEFTELYKLTFSGVPAGFEFSPLDQGTDDGLDSDVDPLTGMTASFVLTNGENNASIDAGIFETVVPGSIGDFVFFDVDEDGLQDEEETGAPNVTVTLTGGGADGVLGTLDDTTTVQQTDGSGFYNFTGLNPGEEYQVAFSDLPVDYVLTLANQGLNDLADSDPDPLTGQTGIIVLANGEQNTGVDAGIFVPMVDGLIGNFVFSDINMNGIQDFGESGVPGITVTLTGGGDDGVIGTADDTTETQQTTELGGYLFQDLTPGEEYQVTFSNLPEGYEFSPADQGLDDELDSDVDAAGQTQIIVLASDEDNRTIDAGIFETVIPGAIGDLVFSDVSRDGIRDATEVGVPDVTVTLAGGGTDGVLGTADDTTTTQQTVADGSYKFEGLTPGVEYQVTFSNLPAGFEFTQANEGTDDLLDSDPVPLTGVTPIVVLANGEENLSIDAGIIESIVPSSIGDFVFLDANRDGIQDEGETGFANITVTLTGAGPDGLLDTLDDTTATRITDPDGFYEFGDLDEFTELYKLTFSGVPAGFEFSPLDQGTDDGLDSDVDPLTGMTASFVLTNGENNASIDAGIFETVVPGSIGDFVFFDVDEDGLQDEEETGVPNVTVTLTGGGADGVIGTLDDTTTVQQTDGSGFYNFTGLNPGEEYRVAFSDLPVDYVLTLANQGLNDEADSDPDPLTGQSGIIVLANGEQNTSVDAGIFVPTIEGSIGNFVFFDTDEDGIQDEGELGFPNVMVTLTGGGLDGVIGTPDDTTQSKLSSADGFYVFNELNPGEEYQITFSFMELGFGFTQRDAGEDDGIDSDADPLTGQTEILVLATSEDNVSVDAGVISVPIPPAALGNQVFVDENQNGQRDANEPGLSKVGVTLTGGGEDGVIGTGDDTTATTTTDRQGKYNFTDLNPLEEYQVAFDLPTGYEFTAANAAGDKVDSDADPATGIAPIVVLQPDQFDKSIDAGFVPLPSRLGNRVFQDSNANGRQDAGEVGVANVVVTLAGGGADKILGTADDTTATTTTNGTGLYYFHGLTTGVEYQVSFELPTGYEFTAANATGDKADSDADPLTGAAPIIVLKPGTVDRSVDAGLVPLPGSIGDQVFRDTNRNGIRDRGEDNVADVTVTLTSGGPDLVIGSADDVTTIQVTDVNGNYTFENLDTKAEHQVAFSNLPVGFEFTIQDATIDNRDSDANPETGITEIINLKPGQAKVNVDAGLVESFTPGVVNSFVFSDTNGNGIQEIGELGVPNVTVTLVGGGFDAVVGTTDDSIDQQITDENGAFSFGNLIPDREYQIVFSNLPAGFVFTKQDVGTDDLDSDATPTTGASQPFVMTDGAAVDVDAGIVVSAPGLIGNLIFDDVDRDGVQDSGESGISGVTVFLFGGGPDKLIGTTDDTATSRLTNINGAYTFSALNPGEEYQVFIPSLPTGKEFTLVGQGTRADRDSDFDPETGRSPVIVLHSGEENRDIDAGLIDTVVVPTGLIGNKVWEDLDADGFQDANEPGVAGVTITLTSAGADGIIGTEDDTTISRNTNNSGAYAFSGLVAGQYMVSFSNLPAGYSLTIKDAPGVDEARDSDADPITGATDIILLGIGEENRDLDAGLILIPPAAADAVFGAE